MVLLRHGESTWNQAHRFTGWTDVPLTPRGEEQARRAGVRLRASGFHPDLCFTSTLRRALDSLRLASSEMGVGAAPMVESWYLNERHYGAFQGLGRLEAVLRFGPWQVYATQRRYAAAPPPLAPDDPRHPARDARYAGLDPRALPATESLRDTVERMRPFWNETLAPALDAGRRVLVVAHKNSLRALMRLLGAVGDDEVVSLRDDLAFAGRRYLDSQPSHDAPVALAPESTATRRAS
jgi:2,3-bisphosphoglycerate-dependent phosphoglycerate mutase